jgi:hypothetical protein
MMIMHVYNKKFKETKEVIRSSKSKDRQYNDQKTDNTMRRGFVAGFVIYKKGCTRRAAASDKVYQLLAHGRWFSLGSLVSSTLKTGHSHPGPIIIAYNIGAHHDDHACVQ